MSRPGPVPSTEVHRCLGGGTGPAAHAQVCLRRGRCAFLPVYGRARHCSGRCGLVEAARDDACMLFGCSSSAEFIFIVASGSLLSSPALLCLRMLCAAASELSQPRSVRSVICCRLPPPAGAPFSTARFYLFRPRACGAAATLTPRERA